MIIHTPRRRCPGERLCHGHSTGVDSYEDYATIKYSSSGERLWTKRYNGRETALMVERPLPSIPRERLRHGQSYGASSDYDYVTIKYKPCGVVLWAKRYNGREMAPISHKPLPWIPRESLRNGIFTRGELRFRLRHLQVQLCGERLWAKRYNGPADAHDYAYALAVDSQGNVYVTGQSAGISSGSDYATIKYSPAGERLWVKRYSGPGNDQDNPVALAVDAQANVYVTGVSMGMAHVRTMPPSSTARSSWKKCHC